LRAHTTNDSTACYSLYAFTVIWDIHSA
jgi:hypothetical protein